MALNIQIFGRGKSFDSEKAKRFFKERRIAFQYINLAEKGFSKGELSKVMAAVGGLDPLLDPKTKDQDTYHLLLHMSGDARLLKALEHPAVFRAPIVRNGAKATVGLAEAVWLKWLAEA